MLLRSNVLKKDFVLLNYNMLLYISLFRNVLVQELEFKVLV